MVGTTIFDTGDSVAQITDDAGNTYTGIPAATSSNIGGIEIWFAENVAANTRLITVTTASATKSAAIVVWEVTNLRRSGALETARAVSNQPASTVALTPEISTATRGDFVVAIAKVEFQVSGIAAATGFELDSAVEGDGWAHLADPEAPPGMHRAAWDMQAGTYCASIAAFRSRAQ